MNKSICQLAVVASITGVLLVGCAATGPSAIQSGRLKYNEAINATNSQQMLMVLIHNRYEEQSSLLAVSSITANIHVTAGTAVQLGIGDSDSYAGNLVPFSASAAYEENPTISYVPVAGQRYLRQLSSPVPVAALAQFNGNLADPTLVFRYLVRSVNGIHNPDFLYSSIEPDPRFNRLMAIMTELTQADRLHWIRQPQRGGDYAIVIDHYAPAFTARVNELMGLLGLRGAKSLSKTVVLPVSAVLDGGDSGGVGIATRSVLRLMEILSATIELPKQDVADGIARDYPPVGPAFAVLRVRHAIEQPARAAVAVQYRGGWFYIDDRDQATKQFFRLMGDMWSEAIAESAPGGSGAPVLTVPVSR